MQSIHPTSDGTSIKFEDYQRDVKSFLNHAAQAGLAIPTGKPAAWDRLKTYPHPLQEYLFANFRAYRMACEDIVREGNLISNDRQLLWRMLKLLKLRPTADLLSCITDEDVIEIYDRNYFQLFRNLRFFAASSYCFEELMHYPMNELFLRPEDSTLRLHAEAESVFSGRRKQTFHSGLTEYECVELFSEQELIATIRQGVISPLHSPTGEVVALISTLRIVDLIPSKKGLTRGRQRLQSLGQRPALV